MRQKCFFVAVIIVYLLVSLFRLAEIPGEWFGDISNVHEYVTQILEGQWPFYFFQSPGPFYHYLIAPLVLILQGHGYETYKAASVVVGFLGILGTFLFVKEIGSRRLALVTTLVMSVSFWFLVYSRLGNSQIVIPALSSFMSFFWARYVNRDKFRDILLGSVVASLGWYTYPQTFIFPLVFILVVFFNLLFQKKLKGTIFSFATIIIVMALLFVPFVNIVRHQPDNFGKGYIGQKILPVLSSKAEEVVNKFVSNFRKTVVMLHIEGDGTFRVNVSAHPQLDRVSGAVLFGGLLYFLNKRRRVWLIYILSMMAVLILPSISPAIPEGEIPNSGRTIAIIPFVYLLVGAGYLWGYETFLSFWQCRKAGAVQNHCQLGLWNRPDVMCSVILLSFIFTYMVFLNLRLYFFDYAYGLPDHNLAPGKLIAQYIDENFPPDVSLYFASCCWWQWGEPEPKAVVYVIRKPRNYIDHNIEACREITSFPAVVIFSPHDQEKISLYQRCFPEANLEKIYMDSGEVLNQQLIINSQVQ